MFSWKYSEYSQVDEEVEKNFVFEKPRDDQLETISEIKKAIDDGYRYIVLEAGTGTGKSAIAVTLASMNESSYILTVTKQLQDQYLSDFEDLQLVKGRSNFRCRKYAEEGTDQTCDCGKCIMEGHSCRYSLKNQEDPTEESTCEYYYQKWLAMNAEKVISNYPYMFLELNYVKDFSNRALLVCDEAHNLESTIMNQLTLEFKKKDLKDYLKLEITDETLYQLDTGDYFTWIQFIEKIRDRYKKELEKIENLDRPGLNEKISFIKQEIQDCSRFIDHIGYDPEIWIFDYNPDFEILEFKPLKIDNYAKNTLFKYADVCLFMSATILDYRLFAHWLGISPDEIYPIRRKSPFNIKRNPIRTYDEFNMSRKTISNNAPKTIDTLKLILEKHRNDKGLIHSVSNDCKNFLMENLDNPRLIDHDTRNRGEVIEKLKGSDDPLVLVSPSVSEGVDLPGDMCRFQIMYKIPYPDLGDKQTRLRANSDELWYDYRTALTLVQTYGRGMRYDKDYCKTYFIDNRIKQFVKRDAQTNGFLPKSFINAIGIRPAEIEELSQDPLSDEEHKEKIERKYRVMTIANRFLEDKNYDGAIKFYTSLLTHELFINDYHPYLKLSRAYHGAELYEMEVEIIVRFFRSGIYCSKAKLNWFVERLRELSKMGYFDEANIDILIQEFNRNGAKNRILANQPVPQALTIRKNRKILERKAQLKYPPDYFDSVCAMDANMTYDEQVSFKYRLIKYGNDLMGEKEYDKAIGFYIRLLHHELFKNDFYPYRMLSIAYRKNSEYEHEADILTQFFKSGRYCDKKQFIWFKKRLKKLSEYGNFDYDMIDELEKNYLYNGARNKKLSNKPVPTAFRIEKLNQTKRNRSNDYMKDFYSSMRGR